MKNTLKITLLSLLAASLAFGQATTRSTTASAAITRSQTFICVASATSTILPSTAASGSYFGVDEELMQIVSAGTSSTCFNVQRGVNGTLSTAHLNGGPVWVGSAATSTGDPSRPFTGGPFIGQVPRGSCTASLQFTLPLIVYGSLYGNSNGQVVTCTAAGYWGLVSAFWVAPTNCTFAPTTLTTTNTYIQVGASNVFVLNGLSNAAAGTNTLTCNIPLPTQVTTNTGSILMDITLEIGSQTTAPTSLGTSTLATITFPAAATTETASTVTPVAIGGTVTTTSPTLITTVTTAGSFLTIKHTYASQVRLSTDLQLLQYRMPFLQSAAAAMALNTPGLLVHYTTPLIF